MVCSIFFVTFSAKINTQMIKLIVHSEIQTSIPGLPASVANLLLRADELSLAAFSISVVLRSLFSIHVGYHQIFHLEVSRLLHLFVRIEGTTLANLRILVLIVDFCKRRRPLNIFLKLLLLLVFVFHGLDALDFLFSIVNDHNHI